MLARGVIATAKNGKKEKALSRGCGTAGPLQRQSLLICFYLLCCFFPTKQLAVNSRAKEVSSP